MAGLIDILSLSGRDLGEEERIIQEIRKRNYDLIMTKLMTNQLVGRGLYPNSIGVRI